MGDPVTMAAAGMTVASSGLKIAGNFREAAGARAGDQIEAMRMETAAQAAKVRAAQLDAQYRDELNETLSTIDAIRAAQNVNIDSPTSFALQERARSRSAQARKTAKSNERIRGMGHEADAQALWRRSRQHQTTALLKSAGDILSAGQSVVGMAG